MRKFISLYWTKFCIFYCSLVLCSCSYYSFSGARIPGVSSISVPVFDDKSAEFQIQEKLTNSVIEGFMRDNTYRVRDTGVSDSVLRGTITRTEDRPIALQADERAQEFEFYVYVTVVFEVKGRAKPVFSENLRGRGTYASPSDRDAGIEEAIRKLSDDIVNLVVTGW